MIFLNTKLDWKNIDTVLLDMDGTILDLSFDNYFWKDHLPKIYADKNNLSLAQSRQFLIDSYAAVENKLEWYCLDFWSEKLQLDIPQLKTAIGDRIAFRPNAINFLKFLVRMEKTVILATNAHRKSLEIKMLNINFHQYFCELSSSHDFGHPKEEQDYWRLLQQKFQFDPEKTLFIDDSVKILKSAQTFGIKYLLGISQPDLSLSKIDCAPFEAVDDFLDIITHAN